jgi:molybdopterin synthase sulfur carrier subunit
MSNIGEIFSHFVRQFPALEMHRKSILLAVNSEFADSKTPVRDGDEVAFFPPVSGG